MHPTVHSPKSRHIIFFGETDSGKSSIINLLLEADGARVSNDPPTRTQATSNACHEALMHGLNYRLWDTCGLSERRSFFQNILRRSPVKDLKKFLKERHRNCEIDLIVYCVHESRAFKALAKNYDNFCAISRRLAAPVAIVVTGLEKEQNTENWWKRNASTLRRLKMEFDDHACITTLPGPHLVESKEKLTNLITRNHSWEPNECGSYFGSPVQISTRSVPLRKRAGKNKGLGGVEQAFDLSESFSVPRKQVSRRKPPKRSLHYRGNPRQRTNSTPSAPTAGSPPSPIVPPTPHSATISLNVPPNDLISGLADIPPLYSSEDTSSTRSSPRSVFYSCPASFSELSTEGSAITSLNVPPIDIITSSSKGSSQRSMFYSCPTSSSEISTEGNEGFLSDLHIRDLTEAIRRRNDFATHSGAFGDVWKCDLHLGGSSRKVAVKAIKTKPEKLESHRKKLHRELRVWWRLQHRNVVPLLGVVSGFGRLPSSVSPWFSNGSLSDYLTLHGTLTTSERRRLLRDIATGLCYLHSQDIVHGDLHSGNVLIDIDGTACLTDFGLSLVNEFIRTSYLMSGICGNVVFTDPALVKQAYDSLDIFYPTKPCDVYSFGGLILHVLSGRKPYDGIRSTSILQTVINGERPEIPSNIVPQDVSAIQECWDREEDNRPAADSLAKIFED